MATPKVLGRLDLAAATPTNLFTSPSRGATFSIRIVNENAATATIQISISDTTGTIQSKGDIVGSTLTLDTGEAYSETGLVIESGFFCVVESDVTTVSAIAFGMEA